VKENTKAYKNVSVRVHSKLMTGTGRMQYPERRILVRQGYGNTSKMLSHSR